MVTKFSYISDDSKNHNAENIHQSWDSSSIEDQEGLPLDLALGQAPEPGFCDKINERPSAPRV